MGLLGEVSMHDSEVEWFLCHYNSVLHLDQGSWPLDWDHPIGKSSPGHFSASASCGPAKGEWVCKEKWPWEHLQLQEVGLAGAYPSLMPALVMSWLSSCLSSIMHSSCHWWGSSLGTSTYSPSNCCGRPTISPLVNPRSIQTQGFAGIITSAGSLGWAHRHLQVVLSPSLCCMAAALWSRYSSKKSPHSWWPVVLQPGWSLLSSPRYTWPWRAQSVTILSVQLAEHYLSLFCLRWQSCLFEV